MVPPPDTSGDEFPDFENMSLEEQMAWLESLAKRQGANEEELLTSADLDIPIPENAVIDEPGYVPYSISERPTERAADTYDEAGEAEETGEEGELEVEAVSDESSAVFEEAPDPMRWLDALSVQTGEDVPEAPADESEALDEGLAEYGLPASEFASGMDLGEAKFELEPEPAWDEEIVDQAEHEAEPVVDWDLELSEAFDLGALLGEQAAPEGDLDVIAADVPGSADAESWLAELDEQYDASPDEAASPGGDQPEDILAEPVGEEEEISESELAGEPWLATSDLDLEPQPEDAVQAGLASQPDLDDEMAILAGADPMAWLETLAKRQGAKAEELTTAADLDIPELPEDTVVDEPGYVEYSPFELRPREEWAGADLEVEAFEGLGEEQPGQEEIESLGELDLMDDSLAWLSELVAEPDADVASLLAVEGEEAAARPETGAGTAADPLAGMTDDEIAYAQAHGQLTGEQELAWLKRQAAKLAEARQEEEPALDQTLEEVEPAEPAELPAWLAEMRDESLLGEVPFEAETPSPDVADLEALLEQAPAEEIDLEDAMVSESELEAFLKGEFVPEETDQLAEALDAEYDRRVAGDDSEPEWYTQAVAQVEAELGEQIEELPTEEDAGLVEAVPIDMPDWLKMSAEEPEPAPEDEMPAWLTEPVQAEAETDAGDVPEWLAEVGAEPVEEDLRWVSQEPAPDLPEFEERRAPEESPVEARPEVMAQAAESVPRTELFEAYRRRLEEDPNDVTTRLELARALHAHQELAPSMDQYEVLIDNAQLLEDVSNDLIRLVEVYPEKPRVRRLLGDAYMRQGKLQAALDAYRSALDQL